MRSLICFFLVAGVFAGAGTALAQPPAPATILNVSYDPTRELYDDYNAVFASHVEVGQETFPRAGIAKGRRGVYNAA